MTNFILFICIITLIFIYYLPQESENFTVFVPSYSPYRIYYPSQLLYPPGLSINNFSSFYYPFASQYFYPFINPYTRSPYYGAFY
jgi:hypothetical protein